MQKFNKDEILNRYERLPPPVKDALFAEATADKMAEIGKKNGLLLDRVGILAEETGYVMIGLVHPKDFISRLQNALGIDSEKARKVAREVNDEVFKQIREHLIQEHEEDETEEKPETMPPAMSKEPAAPTPPRPIREGPPQFKAKSPMIFPEKMGVWQETQQPPAKPAQPAENPKPDLKLSDISRTPPHAPAAPPVEEPPRIEKTATEPSPDKIIPPIPPPSQEFMQKVKRWGDVKTVRPPETAKLGAEKLPATPLPPAKEAPKPPTPAQPKQDRYKEPIENKPAAEPPPGPKPPQEAPRQPDAAKPQVPQPKQSIDPYREPI